MKQELPLVLGGHSFIRLAPLLLYIAAHELVHVVRFERGEGNFEAGEKEKACHRNANVAPISSGSSSSRGKDSRTRPGSPARSGG